ncbi:hypothetical protein BGZ82_011700 [Podila clonocystis]|nr:hypothetical protein BGZ82_011700 [Podila clonocystis]
MSTTVGNIGDVIPNSFIVVLKTARAMQSFVNTINSVDDLQAKLFTTYETMPAFCATLSADIKENFEKDDNVAYIEQNRVVGLGLPDANLQTTTAQPDDDDLWGLTRVCERQSGMEGPYHAPGNGDGITVYVVDTGVYTAHQDFNGRASWGNNFVDSINTDQNGHGTHVAGTIGGTTYGVAKEVSIVGVKVLGKDGSGTTSTVIDGLNWVAENAVPGKSVVNLCVGGPKSRAIDDMIAHLYDKNIPVIVAAGNDPHTKSSGSPMAYTVASMNWLDRPSSFNSPGKNVDVFAPGERILSAYIGGPNAKSIFSGTAIATPHVTGVAAIYLSLNPNLGVGDLYMSLSKSATSGSISGDLKDMPNLIVYNSPV